MNICIPNSIINDFFYFLVEMLPTYALLIVIRIIALIQLWKCLGIHRHIEEIEERTVTFRVCYYWGNFINPIPRLAIRISRKSTKNPEENWYGIFYSDFLNPTHFIGPYIKDSYKSEKGWHDVYFFIKQKMIAFNLHYLEGEGNKKKWQSSDGYYTIKV
jgi:hypothetical protein